MWGLPRLTLHFSWHLGTVASLFALSGCVIERSTADAQSEFVDLYLDEGIRVCGGQMASYDQFIERAFETWTQQSPPSGFRVDLLLGPDYCSDGALGCARPGTAWVRVTESQYHELAHTVTYDVDGVSVRLVSEGAAEALGATSSSLKTPGALQAINMEDYFAATPDDTALGYIVGGTYLRFLLERFGSQDVRSYYRRMAAVGMERSPTLDDFRREFEPIFGETIDATWATFTSAPRCGYGLWYCDATEPISLPFAMDMIDCDDDRTLGFADDPVVSEGHYGPERLVQLGDEGAIDITVAYANVSVRMLWCGECSDRDDNISWLGVFPDTRERTFSLPPGVKVFRVQQIDPTIPMVFELRRAAEIDPDPGDCCEIHSSIGCSNDYIEACVATRFPACDSTEWDEDCVESVEAFGCGACPD